MQIKISRNLWFVQLKLMVGRKNKLIYVEIWTATNVAWQKYCRQFFLTFWSLYPVAFLVF